MKTLFTVLAITLLFTFSCKKDDPKPVVKTKTIGVNFSEYSAQCNGNVKYAGIQVKITHLSDTLYTGVSGADGTVTFTDVPDQADGYYTVNYTTTDTTGFKAVSKGSICYTATYSSTLAMGMIISY